MFRVYFNFQNIFSIYSRLSSSHNIINNNLFQICLTGGPCGGKSTALTQVSNRLNQIGYQTFIVPEIPTMFNQCGAGFNPLMKQEELMIYEANIIKTQIALENSFINIAKASNKPTVILCDRGAMDVAAYLKKDTWDLLLDIEGWTISSLREKRYDAVFHLVTAAIGAEKFYTCGNNIARRETVEEAKELDYSIRECWIGHPSLKIITNESDFDSKVNKLVDGVMGTIGLPTPKHEERRWFIPYNTAQDIWNSGFTKHNKYFQEYESICHYLIPENTSKHIQLQRRISKRSQNGENSYFFSERYDDPTDPSMVNTTANILSTKQYFHLLSQIDINRKPVQKIVRCFVHNDLYFSLNQYKFINSNNIFVLEVNDDSKKSLHELINLPQLDGTGVKELLDNKYSTYELSYKQ